MHISSKRGGKCVYKIKCISSLNKVFPDGEPGNDLMGIKLSAFQNETLSFQCAYYGEGSEPHSVLLQLDSDIGGHIKVRDVMLMPSRYPCGLQIDNDYLDTKPGLYPELLRDNPHSQLHVVPEQWSSAWVDLILSEKVKPGEYVIYVSLIGKEKEVLATTQINVIIYGGQLQKQQLKHTEWFHADCLADYYKVDVWSEAHWEILDQFIEGYQKRGINMILTPIITPPLDVAVGGERTTVQLVGITYNNSGYSFNFDRLGRWIKLCQKHQIEYFEMAHLYTQWGAKATPKIMATVDGTAEQIFGWDIGATDVSYQQFLKAFLPELTAYLTRMGLADHVYFHISDEPDEKDIHHYLAAKKQVEPYLKGFLIIDALSRYAFYESGAVDHPIPGTNHIEDFLEQDVPGLWTYYCNAQRVDMSNRFFAMSLARTRILGVQLYKFNIEGFLHWGYNFYNTRLSKEHINPYEVTDAGAQFPSGDAFLVYPGKDEKPEESIRLMALSEAMQDVRALETLERYTSKEYVNALIDEGLEETITFKTYPKESSYLLKLREKVNGQINQYTNQ